MLRWNKALWLADTSRVTSFNQLKCFNVAISLLNMLMASTSEIFAPGPIDLT